MKEAGGELLAAADVVVDITHARTHAHTHTHTRTHSQAHTHTRTSIHVLAHCRNSKKQGQRWTEKSFQSYLNQTPATQRGGGGLVG